MAALLSSVPLLIRAISQPVPDPITLLRRHVSVAIPHLLPALRCQLTEALIVFADSLLVVDRQSLKFFVAFANISALIVGKISPCAKALRCCSAILSGHLAPACGTGCQTLLPRQMAKHRRRLKMKARKRVQHYLAHGLAVVILLLGLSAIAADDAIDWNSLNPEQQRVLGQFEATWTSLDSARQQRLATGAARWSEMSGEDRSAAAKRFRTWRELSDDQRANIRKSYTEFQRLPIEDRQRIRDNYKRFRRLSPERRQHMRDRYRDMTPEQRDRVRDRLRNRTHQQRDRAAYLSKPACEFGQLH